MRVLRLLRQPAPLALWLGQLFSVTGDKLYAMAVLWLVLQVTGSAKLMAAVSVAESVPYVLAGFLGAGLITRSRRLPALIGLDLLSAAAVAWPSLRVGLAVRAACNLAWPAFTIGLPFELAHQWHTGLGSYGLLLGVFGLGNLAGNLLSGARRVGRHLLAWYCLSWSLVGAGFLALALAPSLTVAALATAWMGIFTPLANVSMDAHIAATVPADRLARVYALQRVAVAGASAMGAFAVAAGIGASSGTAVVGAAGAWMLLAGTLAALGVARSAGRATRRESGPSRP